jgi:hypothetical protein
MIEIENENCTIIIVRPTTGGPKRRHLEFDDREAVLQHACKMELEGIMSKRASSNLLGCSTGNSAGFAPLRILTT